jgi:methylated-DNA-[protein]-cysteine S-methyltransferase
MTRPIYFSVMPSPVGRLMLTGDEHVLTGVYFENDTQLPAPLPAWIQDDRPLTAAREQLNEYFAGKRKHFELPLALEGTAFQRRVWEALTGIPFGTTISYAELARRVAMPKAMRAVGAANGRNPISIVVPCHRVIGADGSLTGYGGGLPRKRWLLELEGTYAPGLFQPRCL